MKRLIAVVAAIAACAACAEIRTDVRAELDRLKVEFDSGEMNELEKVAADAQTARTNDLERLRADYKKAKMKFFAALARENERHPSRRPVGTKRTTFTKSQKRFFDNRRICVKRDTTTIPGSVITTWYRNGRPDTKAPAVVTNVLNRISGAAQNNPLQAIAERLRERATDAEGRIERVRAFAERARDAATLPTTKAIWQSIIDHIDGKEDAQ